MKRTMCAVLMAGLAFSAFASRAAAQDADAPAESHEGHGMSAAKLKDQLGLSDDQVSKLDAAWKSAREACKPYREQVKTDMAKLRDQLKSKASDDEIKTTLDDLDTARKGLRDAMEKAKTDTRSILTPTQQAKMALRMQRRMNQMRRKWRGAKAAQPAQ